MGRPGLAATVRATVALAFVALLTVPAPAAAHPFGPPPTAQISAEGNRITVDWSATPDDAVAIGELLGVMPEGSVALYRQESAAQVAPSAEDEARLSAAPELRDYLSDHIAVTQDGRPCSAEIPPIPDFVHEGARVVLTCPAPVDDVQLEISMLHEIHEAYRTLAVGQNTDPPQGVFTIDAAQQSWRFGVTQDAGTDWLRLIVGTLSGAGALIAVGVLVRRRATGSG